ncbi:hypothetical protein B0T16DRAFT_457045 [Cercophora newfieldiana]|uniref:Uncharacterized protein n=1 Tax=Cercophora newfieldiana TaxID=92897 RepID=A0AA39YBM7_9PEZI|nr:hypothetical protein B0T16DRAFT_457045 [Cercophora newfieldiana]
MDRSAPMNAEMAPAAVPPPAARTPSEETEAGVAEAAMGNNDDDVAENDGVLNDDGGNEDSESVASDAPSFTPSDLSTDEYHADLKKDLLAALDGIQSSSSFAASGTLLEMWQPDLFVHGVGPVSLPLSETRARQIIAQAQPASCGTGNETLSNAWELSRNQFETRNTDCAKRGLKAAWKHTAKSLGIPVDQATTAERQKLLIYQKGNSFALHDDTQARPDVIGTLAISLPSPHRGGALAVKHGGVVKTFGRSPWGPRASNQATDMAEIVFWYSDASCEANFVTEGFKFLLVYKIVMPLGSPRPSAALARAGARPLRHAVRRYLEYHNRGAEETPDHLYYYLDENYDDEELSLQGLKGVDRLVVEALANITAELELDAFFTILEKEERGMTKRESEPESLPSEDEDEDEDEEPEEPEERDWHYFDDVIDSSMDVKVLGDLDGNSFNSSFSVDEGYLLDTMVHDSWDPFENSESGETDYTPWSRHRPYDDPQAIHWHRQAAIALVPRGAASAAFLSQGYSPAAAQRTLYRFAEQCHVGEDREVNATMARGLAKRAWGKPPSGTSLMMEWEPVAVNRAIAERLLDAAIVIEDYGLYQTVMSLVKCYVEPSAFYAVRLRFTDGDDMARDVDFEQLKDSLMSCLLCHPMSSWLKYLRAILSDVGVAEEIDTWAVEEVVPMCLTMCKNTPVGEAEAKSLILIIEECVEIDIDYINTHILPVVALKIGFTSFALTVLEEVIKLAIDGQVPLRKTLDICKPYLKSVIAGMDISTLGGEESNVKVARLGRVQESARMLSHSSNVLDPRRFADFLVHCRECSDGLAMMLCFKIASEIDKVPKALFTPFWVPFVHHLIPALETSNIPLSIPRYQQLACSILEKYTEKCVGRNPNSTLSFSRQTVSHDCQDCTQLNVFLRSATREHWNFTVDATRARHLQKGLSRTSADCKLAHDGHTLQVSKLPAPHSQTEEAWRKKFTAARQGFAAFNQDKLRQLLGSDYSEIITMRALGPSPSPAPAIAPAAEVTVLGIEVFVQGHPL